MAATSITAAVDRLTFGRPLLSFSIPPLLGSLAVGPRRCHRPLSVLSCASTAGDQQLQVVQPKTTSKSGGESKISRRVVLAAVAGSGFHPLFVPNSDATEFKQTNLPIENLKDIIEEDIIQRQYYVTGDLTQSIYDENCRFQDPTVDLSGVKKYAAAVATLFDAPNSKHEILSIGVTGPHTVEVSWRLTGYLNLPWRPYIPPYEGVTTYTTNENGLIKSHSETWNISLFTAFIQALTPSWFNKDAPK